MGVRPREIVHTIGRSSKRIAVTVVGAAVVVAGLAMLVLPGPGMLVVALGFAILGTEYDWAAAVFERVKRAATRAARATHAMAGSIRRRFSRR